ncbi:MAG TPA: hypothetical protein VHB50_16060 [Bryobacteraceae bacterium]|nr:hypothetical protein [Bryobacteraceae bacterium]
MRWIVAHLFWDKTGTERTGFVRGLWATRKLSAAVLGSAVLTWWEWVKHHPPEIVVIALIHFIFVLALIAVIVQIRRWFHHAR